MLARVVEGVSDLYGQRLIPLTQSQLIGCVTPVGPRSTPWPKVRRVVAFSMDV